MQLVVLGLNHKTAPIAVRERFSFSEEQIRAALHHMHEQDIADECVILSTCNRSEVYAVVPDAQETFSLLASCFEGVAEGDFPLMEYFFYHVDEACIRHLFQVTAGLDSLVIGEGQILSQVKAAYAIGREAGTTSTVLNTLFNRAIAVGKKVRTETKIAHNAVSVSYAAVEMAKKTFGDLSKSNVLILGAGEMGELTARNLVAGGVNTVFVSNRNYSRAVQLAELFNGVAVPFDSFLEAASEADVVITSTGAPHYIVKARDVAHLMVRRNGRPIIFIDIAVPRDVEPEVAAISGVRLHNIDDLEAVVESNLRGREKEARIAEAIVEAELAELVAKFRYLSFQPTLALLTDKMERMRQREVKRALAKLPDCTSEERKVLENMSKMLVRKLLREPMIRMNEAAGTEKESYYQEALRSLFHLDDLGKDVVIEKQTSYRYARK